MLFKKKNIKKIDFLIIGTQKGGTSALDHYLRQHPDIGMANKKELHFFDDEKVFSSTKTDYRLFHDQFDFSTHKKVYGEATPIYLYWAPSCQRIWQYNPNIKLIAILRNPTNRAFSHWNMEFDRKFDTESFEYCIKNERKRCMDALPQQHRIYSYTDRGFYAEQIRRYRRYFPDKQLLFIKYEDFKSEQENALNNIFNFLGVSPDKFSYKKETIHQRQKHATISEAEKKYLLNLYQDDIRSVEKQLNWDCSDWLTL